MVVELSPPVHRANVQSPTADEIDGRLAALSAHDTVNCVPPGNEDVPPASGLVNWASPRTEIGASRERNRMDVVVERIFL